jgi:DNA-binding response OmpR family regulator
MARQTNAHLLDHVRVLIIEDDEALAALLADVVTDHGATPRIAGTATEARMLLSRMLPDIILLDLFLPDANGLALLAQIRSSRRTDMIPVIVISGYCFDDMRADTVETGADYILPKPFSLRELVAVIHQRVLARRRVKPVLAAGPTAQIDHGDAERFLTQFSSWIENHYMIAGITVDRAARELGMSEAVLQRRCNLHLGCSFIVYLNNWRLARAHDLILGGSYNMAEIAYRIGFGGPSYFTSCFRRRYGITPKHLSLQIRQQRRAH